MPNVRVQVTFDRKNAIAEDMVTNTWHFYIPDTSEATLTAVGQRVEEFYTLLAPATGSLGAQVVKVDSMLSPVLAGTARMRMYRLDDSIPRAPIYDEPFIIVPGVSSIAMPAEVAVCLSYRGNYASGVPRARRRGRIYLGPIAGNILSRDSNTYETYVAQMYLDNLCRAAAYLASRNNADTQALTGADWIVWSPTGLQGIEVAEGWVDNAPDIQRRRGIDANVRTAWVRP